MAEEPQLASQYRVSSIPALVFIVDGKLVAQSAGAASEMALRRTLNPVTGTAAQQSFPIALQKSSGFSTSSEF